MKHITVFSFLTLAFLFTSIPVSASPPGWEDDIRITSDSSFSGFPKLALDSQGNIHSTWQENRDGNAEIYYKKLNNTGSSLTSDIRLTSDQFISFYPSISKDQSGNIHIVWLDDRDGNSEIYYTKLDNNGNTVVDDTRLTTDSSDSALPAIAADSSGNLHVVWVDGRDGNAEIYYKKLDSSGAPLTQDIRLTTDPAISWQPTIAVDSNNLVHAAWVDDRDGNSEIYYTKLDNNGNTVVDDTRLTTDASDSSYPSLARDFLNNLHLVWLDDRDGNPEIYYKKLDNNGNPLVADTRLTTDLAVSWFPAVSTDPSGGVHIAWVDNRDNNLEIYYTKLNNNGVTVVDDTRLTTDPEESTLPAASSDIYSVIHLLWKDLRDANEEVYYKRSLRPEILVQGAPNISQTISLQLSDQFNPNIQYILVMALSSVPGMPLGDGRIIPVNPDLLLMTSLQYPNSIGLSNNIGILNPQGQAQASWMIPNVPQLAGVTVYFAHITLDSSLPFPQSITSISPAVPVTLLP